MTVRFFRVGGCVRDEFLGIASKDIDFAVEAPSWEVMQDAVRARCSEVWEGASKPKFFTMRGRDDELGDVDFVLCRKDGFSSDGRHPDECEVGTIFDDLARRDFTINAMAIGDEGELLDPHNGRRDIRDRMLRFVGDPATRLAEDALRAFRALRFAATKRFWIDPDSAKAIRAMNDDDFFAVSTERMRDELGVMFAHDTNIALLELAEFPNLLRVALDRGLWLKPTMEVPK